MLLEIWEYVLKEGGHQKTEKFHLPYGYFSTLPFAHNIFEQNKYVFNANLNITHTK